MNCEICGRPLYAPAFIRDKKIICELCEIIKPKDDDDN
jgi:hypothetical protein